MLVLFGGQGSRRLHVASARGLAAKSLGTCPRSLSAYKACVSKVKCRLTIPDALLWSLRSLMLAVPRLEICSPHARIPVRVTVCQKFPRTASCRPRLSSGNYCSVAKAVVERWILPPRAKQLLPHLASGMQGAALLSVAWQIQGQDRRDSSLLSAAQVARRHHHIGGQRVGMSSASPHRCWILALLWEQWVEGSNPFTPTIQALVAVEIFRLPGLPGSAASVNCRRLTAGRVQLHHPVHAQRSIRCAQVRVWVVQKLCSVISVSTCMKRSPAATPGATV